MHGKIVTDIEQSKVLAEILPPESADLWWTIIQPKKYEGWELVNDGESFTNLSFVKQEHVALASYKEIPAWSLSALLEVFSKVDDNIEIWSNHEDWHLTVAICEVESRNIVDACYEMIVTLKEKGLL